MKKQTVILMVDDDHIDIMAAKRAFKKNKITNPLYVVENGEEALSFLRREGQFSCSDSFPRPNLILLDLNMPRMNGIEFLQVMKDDPTLCDIPVVVFTTSKLQTDIHSSFKNGAAGYFVKPVKFDEFVQTIDTLNIYWTKSELPICI